MKKSNESVAILVAFLVTIVAGIYLFIENNKLKERIEKFIPAAVQLQNENELLKHNNQKLIQDLSILQITRDSLNQLGIKESVKRGMFNNDSLRQTNMNQPGLNQTGNFNDLNKGIK